MILLTFSLSLFSYLYKVISDKKIAYFLYISYLLLNKSTYIVTIKNESLELCGFPNLHLQILILAILIFNRYNKIIDRIVYNYCRIRVIRMREIAGLFIFSGLSIVFSVVLVIMCNLLNKKRDKNTEFDCSEADLDIYFSKNTFTNVRLVMFFVLSLLVVTSFLLIIPVVLVMDKLTVCSGLGIIGIVSVILFSLFYAQKKDLIKWD